VESQYFRLSNTIARVRTFWPDNSRLSVGSHHLRVMPKRNGQGIDLLADPARRAIVSLLALNVARGGLHPSKIAKEIGLSRPAISRQLGLLRKAELVSRKRDFIDHRKAMYFIDPKKMGQIAAWLAGTEVARAFPEIPRPELPNPHDHVA